MYPQKRVLIFIQPQFVIIISEVRRWPRLTLITLKEDQRTAGGSQDPIMCNKSKASTTSIEVVQADSEKGRSTSVHNSRTWDKAIIKLDDKDIELLDGDRLQEYLKQYLAQVKKENNWTNDDLCDLLGIKSASTICKILSPYTDNVVRIKYLFILRRYLKIDLNALADNFFI